MSELWKHQVEAIERAKERDCFALFMDMGTGKTRTMLEVLRGKYNAHKRILRTVVFCPIIVQKNWYREIALYTKIPREKYFSLEGSGMQKVKKFSQEAFNPLGDLEHEQYLGKIFIVNYETILNDDFFEVLQSWNPEVLVLDEAHRCARIAAARTKRMIKLADQMEARKTKHNKLSYKYLMTGTPILKDQMDLFAQFKIMDGGKSLGENFFQFRAKFFADKNAGMPKHKYFPNWQPRKDMEPVLTKIIADKSMAVKKSECLDLPPLVKKQVFTEMGSDQKKMYESMRKNLVAYLDSGEAVVANLALTKALRLQQIVAGFCVTDEGATVRFEKNPRLDALIEMLEDLTPNHKVIVWTVFKETYAMIGEALTKAGINHVFIHGEVPTKERYDIVDAFNNDKDVRVLVGNPGAGGIGINLIASDISIWYSRNFSLEQDVQAEARNYRGGSEIHEKVTRIDMVCSESIDEKVLESLASKQDLSKNLLDFKKLLQSP